MDCGKVGKLILDLRKEKGLTQQEVADLLNISNKTVSKWERGYGCPDVSLLSSLSEVLGADIQMMLEGELDLNRKDSGNFNRVKFYVCPMCQNVLFSSGKASIFCCGRKVDPLKVQNIIENHQMQIDTIENDYFISIDHEMDKSHYISFVAFVTSDKVLFSKLYPEQSPEIRIPKIQRRGKLYAYCSKDGLWAQGIFS